MSVGEVSRVRRLIPVAVAAALFAACSSWPPGRPGIAGGGGTSAGASGTGGTTGGAGHGSGVLEVRGAAGALGAAGNSGAAGTAGGPGATGFRGRERQRGHERICRVEQQGGRERIWRVEWGNWRGWICRDEWGSWRGWICGHEWRSWRGRRRLDARLDRRVRPRGGSAGAGCRDGSNPVTPSGRLFYEVTVSNVSAQAVSGVTLSVLLPASLQFNGATDANPDASCFNNNCAASTRPSWALGSLALGATQIVTGTLQVITSAVTDGDAIAHRSRSWAPGRAC